MVGLAGLQAEAFYKETLALTAQPKSRRKLAS
jgi:hypothetical protein